MCEPTDYIALWQQSRLSILDEIDEDTEVLKVGDAVIGTLGNFSAFIGKAKSRKTFNLSAVVAATMVNGTVLGYSANFPPDKRNILYVDTEQSLGHCQKVYLRILRLAGLPTDQDSENIQFLSLRKYSPATRLGIIETAIRKTENLGLVVIDGIRDLVVDINSPSESTAVISKLMQWTDEYQIHLTTVLHQNKADDNARGHIGTELNNKAETVIQVEKDKDDHDISKVEGVFIRDKEFQPFAFRINDDRLPELVEGYVFEEKKLGRPKGEEFDPSTSIPIECHKNVIDEVFPNANSEYNYKDFQNALKSAYEKFGYPLGNNKIIKVITFLTNKRIIIKNENKKTAINPLRHW